MRSFRSGQSIVEVLIGIAVGAILIVGAAAVISPALTTNKQASKVEAGAAYGKELADNVRAWSEGDWHNILNVATGTANPYYLNTATSPFVAVGASSPGFVLNQTGANGSNASGISTSCTFAHRPNPGDLEIVGFDQDALSAPTATVQDASGNVFTVTPTSPTSTYDTTITGTNYLAYLLNAPANASQTITATFGLGSAAGIEIECDDFSVSGGGASFDQAEAGSGIGTAVNTPSVAVTGGNTDLLYAEYTTQHSAVSANAPWTLGGGGINSFFGGTTEYILNGTSTTAANFTANPSGDWNSQGVSFKFTSSGVTGQSLTINGIAYSRYFYVSDVYRDSSGNVTSTIGNCVASAPCYDPSTKQVTVVYGWTGAPTSSITEYVTRDRTAVFDQADWSGGAGATSPVTTVSNVFASSTGIVFSTPGALTVALTEASSSYSYVRTITIDHTKVPSTLPSPAFVQAADKEMAMSQNFVTVTFPNNVTANDVIALAASGGNGLVNPSSMTATCVTGNLTMVNAVQDNTYASLALGYGIVSTSGTCTVTVTWADAEFSNAIAVEEISGVDTANPLDGNNIAISAFGSNPMVSGNITTASSGDYIFGATAADENITYTASTGFIERANDNAWASEDGIQSSSGSIAAAFVPSGSSNGRTGVMAFRPAVNLYNFPVLLSGTYSYLKTAANGGNLTNANGYDATFYAVPQIGLVQSAYASPGIQSSATTSFAGNVTANDVIAVATGGTGGVSVTSITATCVTGNFTIVTNATTTIPMALAYGVIGTSGPCTVTVNFSGSTNSDTVLHEISGVNTASPLDGTPNTLLQGGTTLAVSSALTTTNNGDYIFGASFAGSGGTTYTSTSTFNLEINQNTYATEDAIQPSAGSITAEFVPSQNSSHRVGIMAFQPLAQTETNATIPLDFEQQTYSSSTGVVDYWVKVPVVSSVADTVFYMFYDNSTITTDQSSARDVWRDGYAGVWHLENGTTLNGNDSSPNGANGTLYNGPTATTGKIGGAGSFNAASVQAVSISPNVEMQSTNALTMSIWFNIGASQPDGNPDIFSNFESGGYGLELDDTGGDCSGSVVDSVCGVVHTSGSYQSSPGSAALSTSTWHYGVLTYDGRAIRLYIDGSSTSSTSAPGTVDETDQPFCIGGNPTGGACNDDQNFTGSLDEARISTIARSADWITTEYNNQNSPSTFYSVGSAATP